MKAGKNVEEMCPDEYMCWQENKSEAWVNICVLVR